MKELTGTGTSSTDATPEQCMTLLEAIDGYPTWYPEVVKQAEVLERDAQGRPTKAHCVLHVERGPMTHDFNLTMAVIVDPAGTVKLSRIPHEPGNGERFDVAWRVDGGDSTRIQLDLLADLNVPRFIPLGGVGNEIAQGMVTAATRVLASS